MPRFRKTAPSWMSSQSGVSDRLSDLTGFGANPGDLRARIHVPDDLPPGSALVVALHGCTQTASGYDTGAGWSALADRAGFAVLLPEQSASNNPNRCFNWFQQADIGRHGGEAESIAQMVAAMISAHRIDPARVFVTGLSAGGAMTAVMLATYPDVFAGGAVIGGLPYGSATSVAQAFERMRGAGGNEAGLAALARDAAGHIPDKWPTLSIWHGGADRTVDVTNMAALGDQWRALHGTAALVREEDTVDGAERQIWRAADGRSVVEEWHVPGMGHGVPIDPTGPDALGAAGAYMLDVGVSSTAEIARSWGLIDAGKAIVQAKARAEPRPQPRAVPKPADRHEPWLPNPRQKIDVQKVIQDALKSAGLIR